MLDVKKKPSFQVDKMSKIREMLEYVMRDQNIEITSQFNDSFSFKYSNNTSAVYSSNYFDSVGAFHLLLYSIPQSLGLSDFYVDITDLDSIVDAMYHEYRLRKDIEEVSEEIPEDNSGFEGLLTEHYHGI